MPTFEELATWVRRSEIGAATLIASPFGARRMYYADLTASARALSFIEARVARVLPLYANVHSASSTAGRATAALREDARRAVARGVGAGPEDVVLFVGSGATAAVNKLVGLLGLGSAVGMSVLERSREIAVMKTLGATPKTIRRLILSEAIVTADYGNAQRFIREVNSGVVLVNASTRFADGNQLGLGAEIGISTTKLHSFGPMGLEDLTTTKFIVYGDGQIRQ